MSSLDRTVHAAVPPYWELVRYEKAGKWYLEGVGPKTGWREHLSLAAAVQEALRPGAQVFFDRPGGSMFDTRVRERRSTE